MFFGFFVFTTVFLNCLVHCKNDGTNWAVLVAGSNSYYNYRHQADISHAFQILTKLGQFPTENVIVMMYDDIAYNPSNPYPGELFNEPSGENVYQNINISYRGNKVNKDTFLNVLKGKSSLVDGPVLKSQSNDHVFIYFSDHGAPGLIAMPYGNPVYSDELIDALTYMYKHNMYQQLVFYLEACESGSMFADKLLPEWNIYAFTAANPYESSYAFYYNATLQTYMADEFSIRWMQDTTEYWQNIDGETLLQQYNDVKKEVTQSHPQKYGAMDFLNESVESFQAFDEFETQRGQNIFNLALLNNYTYDTKIDLITSVNSRDVHLAVLNNRLALASTNIEKDEILILIKIEMQSRLKMDHLFSSIVFMVVGSNNNQNNGIANSMLFDYKYSQITNIDCLKNTFEYFNSHCHNFTDYGLKYVKSLVNLCENYQSIQVLQSITHICNNNNTQIQSNLA